MIKTCIFCGKEYDVKPSRYEVAKFCSHKCSTDYRKGKTPWNKGLTKENDSRVKKISESLKDNPAVGLRGEQHPMYGKKHSKESKEKMSRGQKEVLKKRMSNENERKEILECLSLGSDKTRHTIDTLKSEVANLTNKEYEVVSTTYTNARTKVLFKHNTCGKMFEMAPYSFKGGRRCPHCASSYGEKKINDYLNKNEIEFVKEKRFSECKDKLPLPFDFYIPKLNLCIEYDGEQHFKMTRFSNREKKFETIQKHDEIKNKYCMENHIKLLRIPYTEFNHIESILDEIIRQYRGKLIDCE